MSTPTQYLYRCDVVVTGPTDEDLLMQGKACVYRHRYRVIKQTREGKWIDVYGKRRWVSDSGKKRFAYPTEEQANVSFLHRQRRRLEILETHVAQVRAALTMSPSKYVNVY